MAGERRARGDLGRLQVADLADHDDIGIEPDDGAQQGRETEPDLRVHLDLVDARELILDRVLDGDDLGLFGVEREQGGIERGGLARAGGAGDEQDAVGGGERVAEAVRSPVHHGLAPRNRRRRRCGRARGAR